MSEVSGDRKSLPTNTDTIKLRGEIIFIPTNETYTEGDAHLLEPILRTVSINLYLWDERLVLSGRQFLQWRCSHQFKVMIKRDGDAEPLLESLLEFDPTSDTSWRALRAEVEIPVPINWEDRIYVDVCSDGAMPVYDVRGVMMADKEVEICFMAFGNAKGNGPKLIHVYKDEEWKWERGILAGLGLDQSLMAGLEEL
ncbi:hypothetical protein ZTR_04719 [Talaromyces verruculosus]|nr:hypothetical protein ZTR_04719 [Talaromyces verruculosus]